MKLLFGFLICISLYSQNLTLEQKLDQAFKNAKKGIYWAFENVPTNKQSLSKDLISNDTLICNIKISKEVQGIKVETIGYFESYSNQITLYRSYTTLRKEGYSLEFE